MPVAADKNQRQLLAATLEFQANFSLLQFLPGFPQAV
jgi:hypothetical protein